jgi:hypothetical protein
MAAALVSSVPVVVLYLVFQRYLVHGPGRVRVRRDLSLRGSFTLAHTSARRGPSWSR